MTAIGRCVALCVLALPVAPASTQSLTGIERFISAEMNKEQAPGLALAVVKDGRVIHLRGYGYRDIEKKLPVTPDTLFAIASVSKSVAVLTLGSLVADGRLEWDRPVQSCLSDFRLHDRFVTEQLTLRDMVTHRSGLPRHDWLWSGSNLTRAELFERLPYLELSAELRSSYQYNNLMYAAAGHVAERITGMPWDQLVQQRIFRPLGMSRSFTDLASFSRDIEPAVPYAKNKSAGAHKVEYTNLDNIAPAGSINSTAKDMSRYLLALLADGRLSNQQVLHAETLQQMTVPQTIIPDAPRHAELGRKLYGMGLVISTYRGRSVISHGGDIDGFTALLAWLPEVNAGLVLLINQGDSQLRSIVSQRVFDLMLGLKPIDWSARYAADKAKRQPTQTSEGSPVGGLNAPIASPARPLSEYVGRYEHPAYGTVEIGRNESSKLTLTYHGVSIELDHFNDDVFAAPAKEHNLLAETNAKFTADWKGEIASVSLPLEPEVAAIVFSRSGDARLRDPEFLRQYVGTYRIGKDAARISLQDGALTLSLGSHPSRRLLPFKGTRFAVEGRMDHAVEFIGGDAFVYLRPDGDLTGARSSSLR